MKHSQAILKARIADDDVHLVGYLGSLSSLGFSFGPTVGGIIYHLHGFTAASWLAASVFVINTALVFFLLPNDSKRRTEDLKSRQTISTLEAIGKVDWNRMWDIFLVKFLMGLGVLVFRSNFALSLDEKFGATPQQVGYTMSYSGAIGTIAGLSVGFFTNLYKNDEKLLMHIGFVQIANFVVLTFAPNIYVFTLLLTPLGIVNQVARVCMTSITIERNNNQDVGILLGLSASVMSFGRMCAPAVNGFLLEISNNGPGIVAAISALMATIIMISKRKSHRQKED
ncbi:DgyrCDS5982 [Dimorphilus gyrociliatus]|uniref:DgyrCDS5982 n=1 Tax=Dimorphilus gyrociliatus TaxID=2664684 RepID=A0A7I8VLL3_9ANNE|nr:DgyrCDS5982 [Dimorphilus gyrociliatus]